MKRENRADGSIYVSPVKREETRSVPLKHARVYGTDGKEVDRKRLSELLRKPILALCSVDGKQVDPLHLRLIKDQTLIFVGPIPKSSTFLVEP
jgi:hypothetical protein